MQTPLVRNLALALLVLCSPLIAQTPTVKPQPPGPTYSTDALYLFPTYTRETYEAATGKQPPSFDSSRPAKSWYDSTGATSYKVLQGSSIVPLAVSDPASVNLPGYQRYPEYTVEPSGATVAGITVNPLYIASPAQARALIAEIGDPSAAFYEEIRTTGPFQYTYAATEPRRVLKIGNQHVGQMLFNRNLQGVGYPGKWVKQGTDWEFIPQPKGPSGAGAAFLPVPVRDLLPNEQLVGVLVGEPYVRRTDSAITPGPVVDTGFTPADRKTLNDLLTLLRTIYLQ